MKKQFEIKYKIGSQTKVVIIGASTNTEAVKKFYNEFGEHCKIIEISWLQGYGGL